MLIRVAVGLVPENKQSYFTGRVRSQLLICPDMDFE
jgi:hypothetical protein